jgi:mono/diheme cytochrome c family protein
MREGDAMEQKEHNSGARRRRWTRTVVLIVVGMAGGLWMLPQLLSSAEQEAGKGRAIYEKHCLICHGSRGKGDGPTGKVLIPPATDLTSAASKKKSDADLLKIIRDGKPPTAMPAWKGQLSEQDIRDVLAYIRSLSQ